MPYVDSFVIPLPKRNLALYKRMAKLGAKLWMEYGALAYYECVGDDLKIPGILPFNTLAKLKPKETLIVAFIVYKSKAHRNQVNKKVMQDPRMGAFPVMPFDPSRMSVGGFKVLVKG